MAEKGSNNLYLKVLFCDFAVRYNRNSSTLTINSQSKLIYDVIDHNHIYQ